MRTVPSAIANSVCMRRWTNAGSVIDYGGRPIRGATHAQGLGREAPDALERVVGRAIPEGLLEFYVVPAFPWISLSRDAHHGARARHSLAPDSLRCVRRPSARACRLRDHAGTAADLAEHARRAVAASRGAAAAEDQSFRVP